MIELGTCQKPHGIKGEFSFYLYNRDSSVIKKGSVLTLMPLNGTSQLNPNGSEFKVAQISFGNKVICKLEEVSSRNQVEEMIPFKIMMSRESFPKLKSGEVYYCDFVGLRVISDQEIVLGEVTNFYENHGQLILALNISNNSVELPYVESFFPKVDWQKRELTLIEPEEY